MIVLSAAMAVMMAAAATEMPAVVVEAPDSPVKISRATVLTVPGDPPSFFMRQPTRPRTTWSSSQSLSSCSTQRESSKPSK